MKTKAFKFGQELVKNSGWARAAAETAASRIPGGNYLLTAYNVYNQNQQPTTPSPTKPPVSTSTLSGQPKQKPIA